ncbi:uncharacterized protein LOC115889339 isoform X2 [Sitophilus oryzae]|uniref:Uncharacterized protein LOC115889339 isoform X2 n=1 Tax=Sitophilus oryzae TaxID=7048 RepID=A0A6J2YME2_SITOR|nr:uncharacterized protein LOC115889339 isoform X2 [Sitophilus oryzae]
MRELNLLLRQQSGGNLYVEENSCREVDPDSVTPAAELDSDTSDNYETLKLELVNVQLEEAEALEQHRILRNNYALLEVVLEHIMSHLECVIIEIKSSSRLAHFLNLYCVQERCLDEETSSLLKKLNQINNVSSLEALKTQLICTINNRDHIKILNEQFEEKYNNFRLALKNFKIILEILNVHNDSLSKLKKQFKEILMDYQHCRCILEREYPFAIAEKAKVLLDCLTSLGESYKYFKDESGILGNVFRNVARNIQENEYILVKKENLLSAQCSTANS